MNGKQAPAPPAAADGDERPPLRHLILSVGRSCFTRCIGCYNHFGADPDALVPASDVHAFLTHLRGTLDKVTVGGGDPLSRTDLVELLAGIKQLGFAVNLDTVGTPLLGAADTVFYGRRTVDHVTLEALARPPNAGGDRRRGHRMVGWPGSPRPPGRQHDLVRRLDRRRPDR